MATKDTAAKYADLKAFEQAASGTRRYTDVEIAILGTVQVRSLESHEYIKVEAMLTRAGLAAREGKANAQQELIAKAYSELILLMVCNGNKDPLFADSDSTRTMLKRLDAAVAQDLISKLMKHAGLDEGELDDLAKK